MAAVLAATAAAQEEPPAAACQTDADCKLIYSSCSCVAVPASDPRTFLPANVDCAVNRCRAEQIRATCIRQVCEPASKDAPSTPESGDGTFPAPRE